MLPSRQILSSLFASLSRQPCWTLTRTLHSDNPADIQGQLHGTATFTLLHQGATDAECDLIYREEGEMPNIQGPGAGLSGLRWSKKYIWRLNEDKVSVWFAKVNREKGASTGGQKDADEADYLFHDFDFGTSATDDAPGRNEPFVAPPQPPLSIAGDTTVLTARGNHLCINDMYRTAYAFRIDPETGEVLSWASRHVVKGPKKDQDIVNLYWLEA